MADHADFGPENQIYDVDIRAHLRDVHGDKHIDQYQRMRSCLAAHLSYHPGHKVLEAKGTLGPSEQMRSLIQLILDQLHNDGT